MMKGLTAHRNIRPMFHHVDRGLCTLYINWENPHRFGSIFCLGQTVTPPELSFARILANRVATFTGHFVQSVNQGKTLLKD